MAILTQLSRTSRSACWFRHRKQIFSSFRRHALIRRSMASDPAATDTTRFDFLVIGGGSGGLAGARRASELGATTAVIESHKLGGTCVSKNLKKPPVLLHCAVTSAAFKQHTCGLPGSMRNLRTPFVEVLFYVSNEHCLKFKALSLNNIPSKTQRGHKLDI